MSRPFAVMKGDKPLDAAELTSRLKDALNAQISPMAREELSLTKPDVAKGLATGLAGQRNQSIDNNAFNHRLAAYRKAMLRLQQVEKSKGRKEETAQIETGEYDEEGEPVTVSQVTVTAIEALPAEVKVEEYNEETGETKTKSVKNPEIEKDEAERAYAQAVVDSMSDEVKDFNG